MGFEEDVERRRSDLAADARSVAGREHDKQVAAVGHARMLREEFAELARFVSTRLPKTVHTYPIEGARWGRKGRSPEGFLVVGELSDLLLPDGRVWELGTASIADFEAELSRYSRLTLFGYTIESYGDEPNDVRAQIHVFDEDRPWLTVHDMCVELAARAVG